MTQTKNALESDIRTLLQQRDNLQQLRELIGRSQHNKENNPYIQQSQIINELHPSQDHSMKTQQLSNLQTATQNYIQSLKVPLANTNMVSCYLYSAMQINGSQAFMIFHHRYSIACSITVFVYSFI